MDNPSNTQHLKKTAEQLKTEVENLKLELKKVKNTPQRRTCLAFTVIGALNLAAAILNNSYILAFIGLALTFWGALFLFITPVRYTKSNLLTLTAIPTYTTIDRIVRDLRFKGKSYYISLHSQAYSPEYSEHLNDPVIFIAGDSREMPPLEGANDKFLLKNPRGMCIIPPGLGLLKQFEKELKRDFSKLKLSELCDILPLLIVSYLQLAENLEIDVKDSHIYLKILNSAFKDLYITEKLKSVHLLGCPIISAVACAIAKASGKAVVIEGQKVSNDKQIIEVWYRVIPDLLSTTKNY